MVCQSDWLPMIMATDFASGGDNGKIPCAKEATDYRRGFPRGKARRASPLNLCRGAFDARGRRRALGFQDRAQSEGRSGRFSQAILLLVSIRIRCGESRTGGSDRCRADLATVASAAAHSRSGLRSPFDAIAMIRRAATSHRLCGWPLRAMAATALS